MAVNYVEWKALNAKLAGILRGGRAPQNPALERLTRKAERYERLVREGDEEQLRFALRAELLRKHFSVTNKQSGSQEATDRFMSAVCSALHMLAHVPSSVGARRRNSSPSALRARIRTELQRRLEFFNETRHAFGRSALLLSGGARMGLTHVGVVKALSEQGLLPRVIGGASAGSIVAAMLGCKTETELRRSIFRGDGVDFRFFGRVGSHAAALDSAGDVGATGGLAARAPPPLRRAVRVVHSAVREVARLAPRWARTRTLLDVEVLQQSIRNAIGDLTFREAYNRTGRIINITVTPQGRSGATDVPLLLNYLTTPHVVVWSASVASCAIPGVFRPVALLAKNLRGELVPYHAEGLKWSDGSLECDLPMQRLSELFNVNHFIVSQVNPHSKFLLHYASAASSASYAPVLSSVAHAALLWVLDFLRNSVKDFVARCSGLLGGVASLRACREIITQKYEGDITITPRFRTEDLMTLLTNPTRKEFMDAVVTGERNTWPLLRRVRNACAIEFILDDCVHDVRRRLTLCAGGEGEEEEGGAAEAEGAMRRSSSYMTYGASSSMLNLADLDAGAPGTALHEHNAFAPPPSPPPPHPPAISLHELRGNGERARGGAVEGAAGAGAARLGEGVGLGEQLKKRTRSVVSFVAHHDGDETTRASFVS